MDVASGGEKRRVAPKRVVEYVNRLRAQYDVGPPLDDLPPGTRLVGGSCPIAKALCASEAGPIVWVTKADIELADRGVIELPQYVESFVWRFDAGGYPELIA